MQLDFEQDIVPWAADGAEVSLDGDAPHGGQRSLRVDRSGGGSSWITINVALEADRADRVARVSGWVRTDLRGDASWKVQTADFDEFGTPGRTDPTGGASPWSPFSISVPVPAYADTLLMGPVVRGEGRAWFDDVTLTVEDAPPPPTALPQSAAPWSPAERVPAYDPYAGAIPAAWVTDAERRLAPLYSLVSEEFSDLAPFGAAVGDARFVVLGRGAIGVSEYNHLDVRLVKYLHEALGFDVVALPPGLLPCKVAPDCVWSWWDGAELDALFAYAGAQAAVGRPLHIVGYGIRPSDPTVPDPSQDPEQRRFLERVFGAVDAERAAEIVALDALFSLGSPPPDEARAHGARLEALITWASSSVTGPDAALATQHLRALSALARHYAGDDDAHDVGRADNIRWLAEVAVPGARVVVWGLNGDAAYTLPWGGPTIAALLRERSDVYSVGTYGVRGHVSFDGRVLPVQRGGEDSLDALLARLGERAGFIPLDPASPWASAPISVVEYGLTVQTRTLAATYDGLLFVDTLSPLGARDH
jgi:erythromycin esterase-like protein